MLHVHSQSLAAQLCYGVLPSPNTNPPPNNQHLQVVFIIRRYSLLGCEASPNTKLKSLKKKLFFPISKSIRFISF